jgi:hypothetical protein
MMSKKQPNISLSLFFFFFRIYPSPLSLPLLFFLLLFLHLLFTVPWPRLLLRRDKPNTGSSSGQYGQVAEKAPQGIRVLHTRPRALYLSFAQISLT